jgi:hypothetical protein
MTQPISAEVKERVVQQHKAGLGRNRILNSLGLSRGSVTNILKAYKCGTAGISGNQNTKTLQTSISSDHSAEAPPIDPELKTEYEPAINIADQLAQISDIPLSELEEQVRQKQAEKQTLERDLEEMCATCARVSVDTQPI